MPKILIVDDDPHIRELVRIYLQRDGFDIVECEDGVQALSVLDSDKIDLVVLDVMMPHLDGWALCRKIRESSQLPVLMLTAKGETS